MSPTNQKLKTILLLDKHGLTWDDVTILHIEVVMRAKNVARDNRGVGTTMLLGVSTIHHINHTFSVTIPKVAIVRRS